MINSNLVFFIRLIERVVKNKQYLIDLEENRSSQLKVRYSSREFEEKLLSGNFEVEFRIRTSLLNKLSAKEKINLYILLRGISVYSDSGYFRMLFEDYNEYLRKRTFSNQLQYFYYNELDDNMFCYEIDSLLFNQKERRNFYRQIFTKIPQLENINLPLLALKIIKETSFCILPKKTPKRLQRHKGYRDHGSLGSEFSKTLKDIASDYSVLEAEERRQEEKINLKEFLLGLAGFI